MDSRNEEESMSHRSMRRPSAEKCEHHSLQFKGAEKNREKQSIYRVLWKGKMKAPTFSHNSPNTPHIFINSRNTPVEA